MHGEDRGGVQVVRKLDRGPHRGDIADDLGGVPLTRVPELGNRNRLGAAAQVLDER